MGTNYYWIEETKPMCPYCGHAETKQTHIGKQSFGWRFGLHVYPEDNINNLTDWVHVFADTKGTILNEYGDELSPTDLVQIILNSKDRSKCPLDRCCIRNDEDCDILIGEFS